MSSIIYTPATCKDPRNHPRRIYVSCHREDGACVSQISALLREVVDDCVVAYGDPAAAVEDAHWEELADFHLVVIPVTARWFADGIHQAEFAWLTRHHMAAVPLLYDGDLLEPFNRHTDNWQCLCLQDGDFADKWRRALQGLLFDSALTEEVRHAFTHQMFIGYCREDLEQTKALIRWLHSVEQGRRIAVWYDKYLPTGCNFEDSIFAELDASQIFGVTLTPQLLSRENYVETQEFPHARQQEKKIVFFEMEPVGDRPFPKGWDGAESEDRVSVGRRTDTAAYLRRLTREVAALPTKGEPTDVDYRLGLAYQHGLFVEMDHRYAVKKFEASANKGNPDAAHALADKYFYGNGIRRDVSQAVYWYRREIRLCAERAMAIIAFLKKQPAVMAVTGDGETDLHCGALEYAITKVNSLAQGIVARAYTAANALRDEGYLNEAEQVYNDALAALYDFDKVVNRLSVPARYRGNVYMELTLLWLYSGNADPKKFREVWDAVLADYARFPDDVRAAAVKIGRNYGFFLMYDDATEEGRAVLEQALEMAQADGGQSRSIYEVTFLLYRDLGRSYLVNGEMDPEARRENATRALEYLAQYRAHLKGYPFDWEESPFLYVETAWVDLHAADAYRYAGDEDHAVQYYLQGLERIGAVEQQLADRAATKDFPVTFLQLYVHALEGLCNCGHGEGRTDVIADLLRRFSAISYQGVHRAQAERDLARLAALLPTE